MKRVVLLGASNLTMGFPIVAALATAGRGRTPYRLLAAAGHGRGYALPSRVLGRRLPPIAGCGLWSELAREPGLPTRALVADAGNDLAYGAGVAATTAAIASCLERLRVTGAEAVVVLPPLAGIKRLTPARFLVLRSLFFPGRGFGLDPILERLRRLAAELRRLASETGARAVELDPAWLGSDGIHLRWRRRRHAWEALLAGWNAAPASLHPSGGPRWSFLAAEHSRLLALPLSRTQPARRLPDGSTLSFY